MKLSGCGFVLAGGHSSRMGVTKWALTLGGESLLERSVRLLRSLGLPVKAVVSEADLEIRAFRVQTLVDRIPDAGPLGGIHSALSATSSAANYFLPCDAPFVTPELVAALSHFAKERDIVAPVDRRGRLHPLTAFYSIRCLPAIERHLASGRRKVEDFLAASDLTVHLLQVADFNWPDAILFNVNTPEDWAEAQRLAGEPAEDR